MSKYNELITKLASEIVDERVEEIKEEKLAAEKTTEVEKQAEDFDPVLEKIAQYQKEAEVKEELTGAPKSNPADAKKKKIQEKCATYLEHAQMLKQAAIEAYAEAEMFEKAANEVLEEYK